MSGMLRDAYGLPVSTTSAAAVDAYDRGVRGLLGFGADRSWKLIEKLAADIAAMILTEFGPDTVSVEVKKFVIPQARHVAVRLTRP